MFSLSELGKRLKEERERKNLSLEDLQKETKIQKRYLLAIEEGKFDVLPGMFYARAFVKNYAEVLGLDSEQLFAEFGDELPNPASEIQEIPSRKDRPRQTIDRKSKRKSSFINTLIGFVGIIILMFGIYFVVQALVKDNTGDVSENNQEEDFDGDFSEELPADEQKEDEPLNNDDEEDVAKGNEEEQKQEEEVMTQKLQFIETKGNNSVYELSGTKKFIATVEYTGTSYVDIKNAKGYVLQAGTNKVEGTKDEYDFSEEEEIIFNFGASYYVKLSINGETVPFPLDESVQRITVKFTGGGE